MTGPSEKLCRATLPRLDEAKARELALRWARRHDRLYVELEREAARRALLEQALRDLLEGYVGWDNPDAAARAARELLE